MLKKLTFVRYGGLSSVRQKGYDPSMPSFHSPPCSRGIYAFIWPYIDIFLLSGGDTFKGGRTKWQICRDKTGKPITVEEIDPEGDLDDIMDECYWSKPTGQVTWSKQTGKLSRIFRENKIPSRYLHYTRDRSPAFYKKLLRPKKFTLAPEHEVWHHLQDHIKQEDIIERKGEWWVRTTVDVLNLALEREFHRMRVDRIAPNKLSGGDTWRIPYNQNTNPVGNGRGWGRTHLEVFIEKV